MDGQAKLISRKVRDLLFPAVELLFVVMNENQVVHVAKVAPHFENSFNEKVDFVQIYIAEDLTGQVANRNATPALGVVRRVRCEKMIVLATALVVVDDGIEYLQ